VTVRLSLCKLLAATSLLESWPTDLPESALYGEKHVASLCESFGISSDEAADIPFSNMPCS
jgi:hypothetical protein